MNTALWIIQILVAAAYLMSGAMRRSSRSNSYPR